MTQAYPLPKAALDDRLAFVGTSGSGKTYAAGTAVEHLLRAGAKVVIVDPLDVWYGLRVGTDGKRPAFPVVIFGGAHGDLPLSEHAGGLIGEAVAGMAESSIVSLGGFPTKSAERRFMLAFLDKLYRRAAGEPFHIVFDEADLWAPQKSSEPQLQSLMEQIVRRGRVKGFIPWLITQRPAVLSKDVLSQADGLVAMKLTSSQDRDALGAWIEGQADRADEKRMLAALPTMQRGHGIVWIPGRGVLAEAAFPAKTTFDSSRTPKRGETHRTATLKPIDLGKLKERIASIEAEQAKPKAKAAAPLSTPPAAAMDSKAREAVYAAGKAAGVLEGFRQAQKDAQAAIAALGTPPVMKGPIEIKIEPAGYAPAKAEAAPGDLSGPQRTVINALAWWHELGFARISRPMLAFKSGISLTSSHFTNTLGSLRTAGLVEYPEKGQVALTPAGDVKADRPDMSRGITNSVRDVLTGPQRKFFDALLSGKTIARDELAERTGISLTSSHFTNTLGSLRTLQVVDYPDPGQVRISDWVAS